LNVQTRVIKMKTTDWKDKYLAEIAKYPIWKPLETSSNWKKEYNRIIKSTAFKNARYVSTGTENEQMLEFIECDSIPDEILMLTDLECIKATKLGLKTLPDLSKLTKLRKLCVSQNKLTSLPDLSLCPNLQLLD
jgi:hypothetical protein